MNKRETIIQKWIELSKREGIATPNFNSNFRLLDTELDSLGFAILVTELEAEFGVDPFTAQENAFYPEYFNEFVDFYEKNVD